MTETEYERIVEFLKDNTPMMLDIEKEQLMYDEKSMYFRTYKYLYKLKEEYKKLKERK